MNVIESIRIAFISILAHKMRSVLTMLGVAIGVGSIIAVVAVGKGGETALKDQFVQGGSTLLPVIYAPPMSDDYEYVEEDYTLNFTEEDIRALRDIEDVKNVISYNSVYMQSIFYQDEELVSTLTATVYPYQKAYNLNPVQGDLLSQDLFMHADNVVIINEKVKEVLFPQEDAIGKIIEVEGQPLKIIGVYKKQTQDILDISSSAEVIIPLSLYPTIYNDTTTQNIAIEATSPEAMLTAGQKACDLLNRTKPDEANGEFQTQDMQALADMLGGITNIATMLISGIAAISLVVGGIGVMNIMLVSLTERTREIGIRKALGATRQKILLQFLIESMTLTSIGGIGGIILGAGAANLISIIAKWPPIISLPVIVAGVLFSMALGIIFGLLPANNAAKLDPINALRYE